MAMSKRAFEAARGCGRPQHKDLGSFAHERRHELPEAQGQDISSENRPKDALHESVHRPFYPIETPDTHSRGRGGANMTARALSNFGLSDPHPSFARKGDHERDAWFLARTSHTTMPICKTKEAFRSARRAKPAQTKGQRRDHKSER